MTSAHTSITHHANKDDSHKDGPTLRLGDGYLTYDHLSLGTTAIIMDATKVLYSGLQNSILLDATIDHSQLAKDLNVDFSASGGWGNYSGSATVGYLKHINNNQFTENYTYVERFFSKAELDIRALPPNINALTLNAATLYINKGIQAFTNQYGDTFIRQLPMGAYLIINIRLSFSSAMERDRFSAIINGDMGSIFTAGAKIQFAIQKSRVTGKMEVSAFQLGGDPTQLPFIFSKKTDGGYYVTDCALSNLTACQSVINGTINYAQTDFVKQIKEGNNGAPLGTLEVVGEPVLDTYSNKFMLQPAPPLDPIIVGTRLQLATLFNKLKSTKAFFDHLIASPASLYFTPDANVLLQSINTTLIWNWSLFNQFNAIICYLPGSESQCLSVLSNIKQYTKPLDQTAVDYYMNNGFDEIHSGCFYIPVSAPHLPYQSYAYNCQGNWLNGSYIFNKTTDNKILLTSDYRNEKGRHISLKAKLSPDASNQVYSGWAKIHDMTRHLHYLKKISVRLTTNKV